MVRYLRHEYTLNSKANICNVVSLVLYMLILVNNHVTKVTLVNIIRLPRFNYFFLIHRMYRLIFLAVSIFAAFRATAAASQHINKDLSNHYNARFHVYKEPYSIDFTYHNYEQMSRFLRTTSLHFQNLTALYSIGKSIKGMPLKYFFNNFVTLYFNY